MNLISTSKLRKGRRVLEDTVPFFTRIQKTMCDILAGAGGVRSPFLGTKVQPAGSPAGPGQVKRSAVLVITSDKGLAGGYNANIFREVNKLCENLSNPVLILTGAIGYRYFIHSSHLILENFSFRSRLPDMDSAREIAEFIIAQYLWGMFEETYIVYTHMYSTVKLLPSVLQILPLKKEKLQDEIAKLGLDKRVELQFEYLPSEEAVFDALVPMYIKGIIYGCLVEAYASEQSARMSAMDKATKSAQEMLDSLQLRYNRIRQAGITQEMTEIIGGSSVLQ
jgi:F-type H+-transporting ATPase subunit gamma